jgi:hypothetical protein
MWRPEASAATGPAPAPAPVPSRRSLAVRLGSLLVIRHSRLPLAVHIARFRAFVIFHFVPHRSRRYRTALLLITATFPEAGRSGERCPLTSHSGSLLRDSKASAFQVMAGGYERVSLVIETLHAVSGTDIDLLIGKRSGRGRPCVFNSAWASTSCNELTTTVLPITSLIAE